MPASAAVPSPTPPVVRPSLAVFGGLGGALLGSLVARVLMARALSPADLGLLSLAIAWASAAGAAASLGLNTAAGRRVAELLAQGDAAGARRAGRTALALSLVAGGLTAAGFVLAAPLLARFLGPEGSAPAVLAGVVQRVAPVALVLPLGIAGVGISRGFGLASGRSLIRDGGGGFLRAVAVAVALWLGHRLYGMATAFTLAVVVAEGLFLAWCLGQGWLRRPPPPDWDRGLAAGLRPFALLGLLVQARQWVDLLILGALAPAAAVGFYVIARSIVRALEMGLQAPAHAFLPAATQAVRDGDDARLGRLYRRTRRMALALLWMPLGICLLVPEVPVVLLAGAEYAPAASLLRLLALVVLVEILAAYMDQVLIARGRERTVATLDTVTLTTGVVLLLLLVPPWEAAGAALALLGMQLLRAGCLAVLVVRDPALDRPGHHLPPSLLVAGGITAATGVALGLVDPASPVARAGLAAAGSGAAALVLAAGLLRRT